MLTNIQQAQLALLRKVRESQRMAIDDFKTYHKLYFVDTATNSALGAISACASFHIYMDLDSYDATFYDLLREQVLQLDCALTRQFCRK